MNIFKKSLILSILLPVLFIGVIAVKASPSANSKAPDVVPDQYIVVLNDNENSDSVADEMVKNNGLSVEHRYSAALRGFSAKIPANRLDEVKNDPRVQFVSEDRVVSIDSHLSGSSIQTLPTGVNRIDAEVNSNKGTGVGVAVIDTGIDLDHPDLKANISANKNCIRQSRPAKDDNGHGSHVAGTIAAINNTQGVLGVASQAKLIAVKVLNAAGSGTWSGVICGIDWVTANAAAKNIKVANMSLGGGGVSDNNCGNTNSDALHKAICKSRDAGITYVVAAGNSGANASSFVPAAYDDAVITVSALGDSDGQSGGLGVNTPYGADDTFPSWSNYGSVVDIAAPGVDIYSTWRSSSYNTISGTSMATPHVAGAAALYIKSNPLSSWNQVRDALVAAAEALGSGHTDPSGNHPEPVLKANTL
ncbi:hypothetical protein A3B39_04505 [Candidatus Daviesbacteria bacterium RIFCSPLOWO2_01_FULL_37_10]|nr:MAG: hypothetical protein A3B39_04505 [Candidatus Daviesbacteria bacterium RIFCSPLOWO2_01_FULL_37_10]